MPETRELEMWAFARTNRTNFGIVYGFSSELTKLCDETELKSLACFHADTTTHHPRRDPTGDSS